MIGAQAVAANQRQSLDKAGERSHGFGEQFAMLNQKFTDSGRCHVNHAVRDLVLDPRGAYDYAMSTTS